MDADDGEGRARLESFVRENWAALAARAWSGYALQGRGGLLIGWHVTLTDVPRFARLIESYERRRAQAKGRALRSVRVPPPGRACRNNAPGHG